jgi:hypothetical protein
MQLSDYQFFKNYPRCAVIFCASNPTGEISVSVSNAAVILTRIYSRPFISSGFSCFST